ncbi:5'-nucleotidase [Colletotrichum fioriniae PJ7]|uniref:5'-nucleotidase n=1 Tax=Colletotrichum fioriniae PJ7 TaxID=1445577 RepID=A0A010RBA6_9PEZI|nr:5'-nucleotidase [Colletotrichum fioriniae PJ7]
MAYCSQSPWLENGTLRQNILGVSILERKWYDSVISACGLEADLKVLESGDLTVIGSNGVNLSGGQKQRVALARAVYSRCKVVILDDVFSGMDAHTSRHVTNRLLGSNGLFRQHHITAVIATHNRNIMQFADNMIAIDSGRIREAGSREILANQKGYVSELGLEYTSAGAIEEPGADGNSKPLEEVEVKASNTQAQASQEDTDVRRKNGERAVYLYYLRNAGRKAVVMYTVSVVAWIFFSEFATVWIKWWSDSNTAAPNTSVGYYLGIYVMIGILGTVGASLAAWFAFLDVVANTALGLHSDLLQTVFSASLRFLSKTDGGELLNRFSEDMQLVDMDLPATMVNYTSTAISVLAKVVILAVFSQYLGITLPFLATVLYFLQRFYLQTSRQIRLLGIEAKAPLYTHFSESVAGGATIRAFGWQTQYQERNYGHIDTFQRPNYIQNCIQAWLTFVLNLLVAALAVILVSTVVTWHDKFSASSVGVSLIMVIGFSEVLARLIQTWTKLESSVGAVARVRRFVLETEIETSFGKASLLPEWPQSGALSFSQVSASYSSGDEMVLKGVTLTIEAGHHVAICGRSGSGKTSLVLSLLQMMHATGGNIKLDGIDIATVMQDALRSRINVVSQDPFLVPGTIRFNIDPFGVVSNDGEISQALEKVGLWDIVLRQGGLDKDMNPVAWSAGQKQLFCLARAMVRKSKVLILDEATSSVDIATESVMQNIVDTEFAGCTVLAVMHRLGHVGQYDKVALLGDGEVLEFAPAHEQRSFALQFYINLPTRSDYIAIPRPLLLSSFFSKVSTMPKNTPAPDEPVVTFSSGSNAPVALRLLHLNDVYHLEPASAEPVGGVARFITAVNEYRSHERYQGQPELVTLFSGDVFNPSLESSVTKGEHMVPVLNKIGVDCTCVGNHDFDFGVKQFEHLTAKCNFPWLLANVLDPALGENVPLGHAKHTHMITSSNGIKIGLLGLGEREWLETINSLPPNIIYKSASETAKELVPQLRAQGADIIICLSHQREPNDNKLAEKTEGLIDIILGGHDHYYAHSFVNGTHVLRSGSDFKQLSYIEVRKKEDGSGKWDFDILQRDIVSSIAEDQETLKLTEDLTSKLKHSLAKSVGWTASPLDARFSTVRMKESNMGNFVCDVMRHYHNADCALMAAGTIRGDQIYPPGAIRVRDITNCFPFEDPVIFIRVTGQQLWDALENGVSQYPAQEGRFPQVSNIEYTFDPSKPAGSRIVAATLGGGPIEPEKKYTLATRGYMGRGKDGFTSLLVEPEGGTAEEIVCEENGILISAMLRQYFMSLRTVGQWKNLSEHWVKVAEKCHSPVEPRKMWETPAETGTSDPKPKVESKSWAEWMVKRHALNIKPPKDDSDEEVDSEDEVDSVAQIDMEMLIMRKFFARWASKAGVKAEVCDPLHEGEFTVDWTRVIAPVLEGRIKMIS